MGDEPPSTSARTSPCRRWTRVGKRPNWSLGRSSSRSASSCRGPLSISRA